ncbi:glutathione S-transferase 1 [Anastrepha ludens]|uniref:glutathione S-transferase 1 n=1 Tax=Anastrepha ludens TaxID=28586 RepID=UPI0023B0C908|nr:glutathione S-transferase 1 [Anastrepha ludens]XP_053965182.1 glutathione S-transferase 1 [Anastrepha ludens]XP_053965183.1 glutathione S-transferase 1 [Anastrepha ludens]
MVVKPVLYYSPRSAPCRAVLLTAGAIGVELDLQLMNLKDGDHLKPDFLKLNPLHTIPVLDDNGTVVTDSHVICAYLVDTYSPNNSLYPKDEVKRREIQTRLYYDASHLFPRLRVMVEPVIYFGAKDIEDYKVEYMQMAYDGLDKTISQYMCGGLMTIADLCALASVTSAEIFAPVDGNRFPNLAAWLRRLRLLPYYRVNNKVGVESFGNYVKERLEANRREPEQLDCK